MSNTITIQLELYMKSERPWSQTMWATKNRVKSEVEVDLRQGLKWAILVVRSTNKRTESLAFEGDKSMMKLQVTPFQGAMDTGRGASCLCFAWRRDLESWQREQEWIYSRTEEDIDGNLWWAAKSDFDFAGISTLSPLERTIESFGYRQTSLETLPA